MYVYTSVRIQTNKSVYAEAGVYPKEFTGECGIKKLYALIGTKLFYSASA
jgi:hypothetical protein